MEMVPQIRTQLALFRNKLKRLWVWLETPCKKHCREESAEQSGHTTPLGLGGAVVARRVQPALQTVVGTGREAEGRQKTRMV